MAVPFVDDGWMSELDARLDHLMLRIEEIERVLGVGDEGEGLPRLADRVAAIESRMGSGHLWPGEMCYYPGSGEAGVIPPPR
jgi:hypothetical protein